MYKHLSTLPYCAVLLLVLLASSCSTARDNYSAKAADATAPKTEFYDVSISAAVERVEVNMKQTQAEAEKAKIIGNQIENF